MLSVCVCMYVCMYVVCVVCFLFVVGVAGRLVISSTFTYTLTTLEALTTYQLSASFIYGLTVQYNINGGPTNTPLTSGGAVTLNLPFANGKSTITVTSSFGNVFHCVYMFKY
jgi:hypothetical protein